MVAYVHLPRNVERELFTICVESDTVFRGALALHPPIFRMLNNIPGGELCVS